MFSSSTRNRTPSTSSTSPGAPPSISYTSANLPPPRTSSPLKPVSPPLSSTRLSRLIYLLLILTSLLTAYYSYRALRPLEQRRWGVVGPKLPQLQTQFPDGTPLGTEARGGNGGKRNGKKGKGRAGGESESVEDIINALAEALGMPSKELASAIAVAVREYVPPASLSSVASHETGSVMEELVNGASCEAKMVSEEKERKVKELEMADGETPTMAGVMGGVVSGVFSGIETFVGMDENDEMDA